MEKNRLIEFDLLKAFAIYFVILGHVLQYVVFKSNFSKDPVWCFIYTFHMPLFIIISGFFFSYKGDINHYMTNKAKQLLFPAMVGCVIAYSFIYLFNILHKDYTSLPPIDVIVSDLWFLKFIFIANIVAVFFKKSNIYIKLFIIIYISYFCFSSYGSYCSFASYIPFFFIGIFIKYLYEKKKINAYLVFSLSLIVCVLTFLIWNNQYLLYYSPVDLSLPHIFAYTMRIILGTSISGLIISSFFLFNKMFDLNKFAFLINTGKRTLLIYVLQFLVIERLLIFINLAKYLPSNIIILYVISILLSIVFLFMFNSLSQSRLIKSILVYDNKNIFYKNSSK